MINIHFVNVGLRLLRFTNEKQGSIAQSKSLQSRILVQVWSADFGQVTPLCFQLCKMAWLHRNV